MMAVVDGESYCHRQSLPIEIVACDGVDCCYHPLEDTVRYDFWKATPALFEISCLVVVLEKDVVEMEHVV
jgi:hypothetical protein